MRDQHRWKDRIELSLDNRHIFFLFFACAVVLCLVFALGIVVGRKIEAPGGLKKPTDPLAMLDQLSGMENVEEQLSYHEALTKGKKDNINSKLVQAPEAAHELATSANPSAVEDKKTTTATTLVPTSMPAKNSGLAAVQKETKTHAAVETKKAELIEKKSEKKDDKVALAAKAESESSAPKTTGNYTLQLSSFQDRKEAEQFIEKIRSAGFKPVVVASNIPGRGIWFRVRAGSFKSWEDAVAAKNRFEQTQKIIAYVAKN